MTVEWIMTAALLALINAAGLVAIGLDKHKARKGLWRISERTFFLISILGGCPGVYIGMLLFRHKTRHWYFVIGIPGIFVLQILLVCYLVYKL